MSAILKFDFQKRNQLRLSEVNYLNYTQRPNFACDNYVFPKTRGNKNKQWTHSTPLKGSRCYTYIPNSDRVFYILGVIGMADLEHFYDLVMVNWSFKVYKIEINLFERILEKLQDLTLLYKIKKDLT